MKAKMIFIAGIVLLIFSGIICAEDLPDTVFPWGVYVASGIPDSQKDSMETELGLNVINLAWNRIDGSVTPYMNRGMVVYPNAGPIIDEEEENYFRYAEAFYTLIEAEDDELYFRFRAKVGSPDGDYWYYGSQTDTVILDNLVWYHRKYNKAINDTLATEYFPSINMKIAQFLIGDDSLEATDTLALLFRDISGYGIDTSYITASSFYDSEEDTFYTDPVIVECNEFTLDKNRSVSYSIYSTGEAKLYIDYFKVPDQYGVRLIDNKEFDEELIESAIYTFNHKRAAGWYMACEPYSEQFMSLGYIDGLIKDHSGGDDIPRVVTAFNRTGGTNNPSYPNLTPDFIEIADPEIIWADIYGLTGGQRCWEGDTLRIKWDYVYYTGSDSTTSGEDSTCFGLQFALKRNARRMTNVRDACMDNNIDWWMMPQAFAEINPDTSGYNCNGRWMWRLPTKSEVKCCTYMGLCNNARGIVFWKYHSSSNKIGMVNEGPGYSKNPAYYAVEEMNPYIKAIWPTLIELEHYSAHACSSSSQSFLTPNLVYSVTAYCDSTNPDLGWFHIGEFEDAGDTLYFMLVNRACSKDEYGNEAPSVTAVVQLNPTAIGSDFVFVIDIAKGTNATF